MTSSLNLVELITAGFRTTKSADEKNTKLMNLLGVSVRYGPARLAIARSLTNKAQPDIDALAQEDYGKTIPGQILFGSGVNLATWVSLIVEHSNKADINKKDLQNLVGAHWRRGINMLWKEWEGCDRDFDQFIVHLLEHAGLEQGAASMPNVAHEQDVGPTDIGSAAIDLKIGDPSTDLADGEVVTWRINGRGNSPNVGVMGTLGTGKTRLAMDLIKQTHKASDCAVIMFDMGKGDLTEDQETIDALGAEVISCPDLPVPLDVLHLASKKEADLNNAALRFRDSFSQASKNKPGGVQLDLLREATIAALRRSGKTELSDLRDELLAVYEERERKEDGVNATFNDFCAYNLFKPELTPEEFFSRSWIIDVHKAPETVQRLVVFLILDAADAYLKQLNDSPIDEEGNRSMRLMLVIDEARRVLAYQHQSLIELIRTGRSKGGSVMMISQSPDDFSKQKENFLENVGLTVSFRTNATSSKVLNAVYGQKVDLGGLENGVCCIRLPEKDGPRKIKAW